MPGSMRATLASVEWLGLLLVTIAAIAALAAWFASLAMAAPHGSPEMIGASLLTALCLLGVLEHLFLALPFRDGMLWGWAIPQRSASASDYRSGSDTPS